MRRGDLQEGKLYKEKGDEKQERLMCANEKAEERQKETERAEREEGAGGLKGKAGREAKGSKYTPYAARMRTFPSVVVWSK